jgi:hypothetical protein
LTEESLTAPSTLVVARPASGSVRRQDKRGRSTGSLTTIRGGAGEATTVVDGPPSSVGLGTSHTTPLEAVRGAGTAGAHGGTP